MDIFHLMYIDNESVYHRYFKYKPTVEDLRDVSFLKRIDAGDLLKVIECGHKEIASSVYLNLYKEALISNKPEKEKIIVPSTKSQCDLINRLLRELHKPGKYSPKDISNKDAAILIDKLSDEKYESTRKIREQIKREWLLNGR